jgi:hypothetical protein
MDDIGNLVWRLFSRFIGPTDEPPAAAGDAAPGQPAPGSKSALPAE